MGGAPKSKSVTSVHAAFSGERRGLQMQELESAMQALRKGISAANGLSQREGLTAVLRSADTGLQGCQEGQQITICTCTFLAMTCV